MSLRPKKSCVAVSISGVYTNDIEGGGGGGSAKEIHSLKGGGHVLCRVFPFLEASDP